MKKHCKHPPAKQHDGPRVAVRHGTFPTRVCECGMWRTNYPENPGVWQTAYKLVKAFCVKELE